jgi:hypothetical protein
VKLPPLADSTLVSATGTLTLLSGKVTFDVIVVAGALVGVPGNPTDPDVLPSDHHVPCQSSTFFVVARPSPLIASTRLVTPPTVRSYSPSSM